MLKKEKEKEKMGQFYEKVRDRLIRYAKVNTESSAVSKTSPTTDAQFDLAGLLYDELNEIGAEDTFFDREHCLVYGNVPATKEGVRPFALISHLDTAPDAPGKDVKPWVLKSYDGGDIILNKDKNIVMKVSDFPNLKNYIGEDLILTDGTTLLGGDDKAGIAAVMTMAEYLLENKTIEHGKICIAFTPDEEVGGLAKDLDFKRLGADIAYTLDGDHLGYYEDETFNAIGAVISINGRSVHTGTAKNIMINAIDLACEFMGMFPKRDRPQFTEGREGFYHMCDIEGNVEHITLRMIVRDHSEEVFEYRKHYLTMCADAINEKYGEGTLTYSYEMGYKSMKKAVDKVPFMIDNLTRAIKESGLIPHKLAFRGGTDGSSLSERGLPCPNISAGYENAHGRFEYVPIRNMEKNVDILVNLAKIYAE